MHRVLIDNPVSQGGKKKKTGGGFWRAHGVLDLNLRIGSHLVRTFLASICDGK